VWASSTLHSTQVHEHKSVPGVAARQPKFQKIDGEIETFWQRPRTGDVKGLVLLAHGCNHQAADFFDEKGHDGFLLQGCRHSKFQKCLGLPEERSIVQDARDRGYVVMAVSSTGFKRCWDMDVDIDRVKRAVDFVSQAEELPQGADIIAIGASSGGAFVGALAATNVLGDRLKCIAPQISPVPAGSPNWNHKTRVVFVHMPKDDYTAEAVKSNIETLSQASRVKEVPVLERPVRDVIQPHLSPEDTSNIVKALQQTYLNESGFLTVDPRRSHWRESVKPVGPAGDSLQPDESKLSELMNVAWASHEIIAQYNKEVFEFCEGKNQ